ncbi:MAG: hypothetical protein J6M39_07855 [Lachnospiraceae bacterium]|nr:hypothetical protein [Lachnospiraceae bacterium]
MIKTIKAIVIKLIQTIKKTLTNTKTISNNKNEIKQIMNGGNNNTQIGIQNNN